MVKTDRKMRPRGAERKNFLLLSEGERRIRANADGPCWADAGAAEGRDPLIG